MRVALYARVSTHDKDQRPENQLLVLREWAGHAGHTIVGEWVDTASADDLRGRVQWRALLARLRQGGVDAVAVTKLDRAYRSVPRTYEGMAYLTQWRTGFVAVQQPDINTTTAAGKLLLGILAVLAEFERDQIRERTRDGMERARAEGKRIGRPPGSRDKRERKKGGYYLRGHATPEDVPQGGG